MTSFEGSGSAGDAAELVAPENEVTLGRALATRRLHLSLDPTRAAAALDVSRSTYAAYEHDDRRLTPDTLRALAVFLDVNLARVLEYYGATCIAQARRALLKPRTDVSATTERTPRASVRRRDHGSEMAVVKRVFFDEGDGSSDDPEGAVARDGVTSSDAATAANQPAGRLRDEHEDWKLSNKSKKAKGRDKALKAAGTKSKKKAKKKR